MAAEVEERERAAIVDAALDYFEGWFTADGGRMRRSLHLVRTREGWKIANTLWQRT